MARIHNEKHPLRTIVPIALFVGASQLAVAQAPKGLNIDVESCVALEKPEELRGRGWCVAAGEAAGRAGGLRVSGRGRAAAPRSAERERRNEYQRRCERGSQYGC